MANLGRIFFLMICFSVAAQAATVIWGTGTIVGPDSSIHPDVALYQWAFYANDDTRMSVANFFFEEKPRASGVQISSVSASYSWAAWGSAFTRMNEGDVVDAVSMSAGDLFSDPYGMANGVEVYERTILIGRGESVYLGFLTDVLTDGAFETRQGYGWVRIGVDASGQLVAETAAIDLDGGPMIVGGGSAIPEPHSGLLLLAGGALLALRRGRRCNTRFPFLDRARSEQVR